MDQYLFKTQHRIGQNGLWLIARHTKIISRKNGTNNMARICSSTIGFLNIARGYPFQDRALCFRAELLKGLVLDQNF